MQKKRLGGKSTSILIKISSLPVGGKMLAVPKNIMFETPNDKSYEEFILNILSPKIPELKGLTIKHLRGASVYDFQAFLKDVLIAEIDVKIRDEASDTYEDYFISKEKVQKMRQNPPIEFYVVYYFKCDKRVKVFDLHKCTLEDRQIEFIHKRSGERIKTLVFCIPRFQFIFDAYLL